MKTEKQNPTLEETLQPMADALKQMEKVCGGKDDAHNTLSHVWCLDSILRDVLATHKGALADAACNPASALRWADKWAEAGALAELLGKVWYLVSEQRHTFPAAVRYQTQDCIVQLTKNYGEHNCTSASARMSAAAKVEAQARWIRDFGKLGGFSFE